MKPPGIRANREAISAGITAKGLAALRKADRQWYLAETMPTKEIEAQQAMQALGCGSIVPMRTVWRRQKHRQAKIKRTMPAFTRHIFIAPLTLSTWRLIFECELIRGVLSLEGMPKAIPLLALTEFIDRMAPDMMPPDAARHMQSRLEFQEGDRVEVLSGALSGYMVDVSEIRGQRATVLAELFGERRAVIVELASLGRL